MDPVSDERTSTVDSSLVTVPTDHWLRRVPPVALAVAAVGFVASLGLGWGHVESFYFSWLTAFTFFLSLSLGCVFFVLVQHCARAGWSVVVRRLAENGMAVLPWFALLFIPVLLGMSHLFHWTHGEEVAADPLLQSKAAYLNVGFFVVRAVFYFIVWILISRYFLRLSVDQDATGDHGITRRLQWASGACLLAYAFTTTFAAFDWLMSLDPHWFSTIFGAYYFAGGVVSSFGLLSLMVLALQALGFIGDAVNAEHYHDLGKLLFAFTIFWAYIGFSQYMLIWYGNIPEETLFFQHRFEGSWETLGLLLIVGHFIAPFFFLMPKTVKKSPLCLALASIWLLAMHYADLYYIVMPTKDHHGAHFSLMDVTTLLTVGGVFVAVLTRLVVSHALIPVRDPRLPESLAFHNVG